MILKNNNLIKFIYFKLSLVRKGLNMIRQRIFISMVIITCTIGLISCSKNEKMQINPIDMEVNIGQLPYQDLEKEWSVMNMDKYILRTAQQIWNTWSSMDKIWPGVDFSKYNVLYVSIDGENAWLINPNNEIIKFSGKDLPDKFKATGEEMSFTSSEETLNGKPTIKVEVKPKMFEEPYSVSEFKSLPTGTNLFPFTVHEEFHNYQGTWKINDVNKEGLLQEGVENFEARQERLEILNCLNKAVLDPDKETQYLEAAKWWFNKYKTDNEKEYNMTKNVDTLEGTARYFDMAVNIRSIKGMDISEDEAFKVYQNMVREDYTFSSDRFFGLPDEESYDIGGLCGIILEKQNNQEWKKEAENGTPPLEILLKNYKQTPQESSPEVKKIIEDIKLKRDQLNNEEE